MKHNILLAITALLISFSAHSAPARRGPVVLNQPDGTTFIAKIRGDEFMKIVTTRNGEAIIQDGEGWWCYAYYDNEGRKASSGHRVGSDVPDGILSRSRAIPYDRLSANAAKARAAVHKETEPLMRRVMRQHGAATKSSQTEKITKHAIIILAQFRDVKYSNTKEDFVKMLTQAGYSANGATGSVKEYLEDQFGGMFDFSFDVSPVVTLPNNVSYYGGNDEQGRDVRDADMIYDACRQADDHVDFSMYDDDDDGYVDNVFVFYAGADEAEGAGEDRIWAHSWDLESAGRNLRLDGKVISTYACSSELSRRYYGMYDYREVLTGIGVFCHEYFHTFGLMDMYDTDYEASGGRAAGLWGSTSLMDSGNQNNYGNTPPYLNAIELECLGLATPVLIERNGNYKLEPVHLNGQSYRIDTDNQDEYYILEYRGSEKWDKHIGGSGMLVYHIDKSDRNTGYSERFENNLTASERWSSAHNEVNCRPAHQCADLIEADGRQESFSEFEEDVLYDLYANVRDIFFPTATVNSIEPDGNPRFMHWNGIPSEISVTNIRKAGDGISFNVTGFSETAMPPAAVSIKTDAFMDAAIILFESDRRFDGEATVRWGRTGSETEVVQVKPYSPGKYSLTLEGLQPGNKTYTVNISFELDGLAGEEVADSFMTKQKPSVEWPYIYMNGTVKNSDGTLPAGSKLPLRLFNASDAAEIVWEFNGQRITVGPDGYYTATQSGTLKALVTWENGEEETIAKEIIIEEDDK